MRTFIIRARKGSTRWERLRGQIGGEGHIEVVAHSIMNAFFISNDFRTEVEVYVVLDSAEDFPRTIKFASNDGISIAGFHEEAIITLIEKALKESDGLQKDETRPIASGLSISGFGFEKLVSHLLETRPIYLLDRKGEDIRTMTIDNDPVFVLSDHLTMPKNIVKSMKRKGVTAVNLGKKMLFASQCIVLIHDELDRSAN